jgi:hypothetical protein
VLFREALATRAAIAFLEGRGIPVRALQVTRLTTGGVEIRDLEMGESGEISARHIAAVPDFKGLSVSLREATIDGLRLHLDLRPGARLLGSLQQALDDFTAAPEVEAAPSQGTTPSTPTTPTTLPPVSLTDAQVIFETPSGPMTADLSGGTSIADNGDLLADFTANLDSELGRLRAEVTGRRSATAP